MSSRSGHMHGAAGTVFYAELDPPALILAAGDYIRFDTDAAIYSGTVTGSGTLDGGSAVFTFDY